MTDKDQEKELPEDKAVKGYLEDEESATSTEIEVANFEQLAKDRQETDNKGRKDHYTNKNLWSYFIMLALTATFVLQWRVVFLIGENALDFRDYDWFLPALFINTLAQIVTLALVVVKGLFDTDESPPQRRKSPPRRRNRWGR